MEPSAEERRTRGWRAMEQGRNGRVRHTPLCSSGVFGQFRVSWPGIAENPYKLLAKRCVTQGAGRSVTSLHFVTLPLFSASFISRFETSKVTQVWPPRDAVCNSLCRTECKAVTLSYTPGQPPKMEPTAKWRPKWNHPTRSPLRDLCDRHGGLRPPWRPQRLLLPPARPGVRCTRPPKRAPDMGIARPDTAAGPPN